jgi:hypothetical protein
MSRGDIRESMQVTMAIPLTALALRCASSKAAAYMALAVSTSAKVSAGNLPGSFEAIVMGEIYLPDLPENLFSQNAAR